MAKKQTESNTTNMEVEQVMRLEDAPSDKPSVEAAEGLNPRKGPLEEIYANRLKQIERESNFGAELSKESVAELSPEPEQPTDSVPSPEVEAIPALPAEEDKTIDLVRDQTPVEKLYTIRDGDVELKLTEKQLVERAQKGLGAERKFQEASALRQEAERFLYGQQPSQQQAPAQQNSAQQEYPKPMELDDSAAEDFLNKLNFGSKDEQKAALKSLVSKLPAQSSTAAMPIDQIVNAATQNAVAALQSQQTMAALGAEFKDVFQDPLLSNAAGILTNQLRDSYAKAGIAKTFWEVGTEALATVRNKYIKSDSVSSQPQLTTIAPTTQVIQMDDKIAAKRAAPKPVVAANVKAQTETTKPTMKSGNGKSDTVNYMRQLRGQPIYS